VEYFSFNWATISLSSKTAFYIIAVMIQAFAFYAIRSAAAFAFYAIRSAAFV